MMSNQVEDGERQLIPHAFKKFEATLSENNCKAETERYEAWWLDDEACTAAVNIPFIGCGSGDVPVVLPLLPPVMADVVALPHLRVLTPCKTQRVSPALTAPPHPHTPGYDRDSYSRKKIPDAIVPLSP